MFLKAKRSTAATGTALVPADRSGGRDLRSQTPSIVAVDLQITGNVSTEGELLVDGRIDGDVSARALTIGESGHINGHVETEELIVFGFLAGSVRARRVHLTTGCRVTADISHESISIDEGAAFEGRCQRRRDLSEPVTNERRLGAVV